MRWLVALGLIFGAGLAWATKSGTGGNKGELGSPVLECYSDKDDGDRAGDQLIIKRHSQYDDWRLYTYSVRVGDRVLKGPIMLAAAKHTKTDMGAPSSTFELIDEANGVGITVVTTAIHTDANAGYADVLVSRSDGSPRIWHSFEGCVPSFLFVPHAMDDDLE